MRQWLNRALQAEVDAGDVTEAQAMYIATRLMVKNQRSLFDIEGKRTTLRKNLHST
jgi:hypothetical protein